MTIVMNDDFLSDPLDVEARSLSAERTCADGDLRNPVDARAQRRQLQRAGGRCTAPGGEAAGAATIEHADQQSRTRARQQSATSQLRPVFHSVCHLSK